MRRLPVGLGLAVVVELIFAAVAGADKEKIRLTALGQAAARAAVLQRADLGTSPGWTGGATKPDLSSTMPCSTFHPKQSDLVLTGAARTVWKHAGLEFDSEAQVLATPAMVRLDWQRTVVAPEVLPCLQTGIAKGLSGSERLVSLRRIPFPQIAPYSRAFRAVVDVTTATAAVQVMIDLAVFGRTEITLSTTAPLLAQQGITAAEIRLARLLVARVRA